MTPHSFTFADQTWSALPGGALYAPHLRALIVADLHLEKASWYAMRGQMLPPYDSAATMDRLAKLTAAHDVESLYFLGDSFHDAAGVHRLPAAVSDGLHALGQRHRLIWVAGNHDGLIDNAFGGSVCEEVMLGGVMLRHQADLACRDPELSGHYHPKIRVQTAAKAVSRPCFAMSASRIILPAFGALTGGLDVRDPVYRPILGHRFSALVPTRQAALRFDVIADP